jgi:hypothetical protein
MGGFIEGRDGMTVPPPPTKLGKQAHARVPEGAAQSRGWLRRFERAGRSRLLTGVTQPRESER